jgi:hypothetical protein
MEIIDDEYWLQYAKKSVENSITSRNAAAAKLEKMTIWFWSLYTASFTIGVSINLIVAPKFILGLLAAPIFLLIITYWFCILAQLPVSAEFDPAIPFEIKEGYNSGLSKKKKRFDIALTFTFISALFLSIALFSLSFAKKKENYTLSAFYSDNKEQIIVSGLFPGNTIVYTSLDTLNNSKVKIQFYNNIFKVQDNGILNLNIPINKTKKDIYVSAVWKDGNNEKGLIYKLIK